MTIDRWLYWYRTITSALGQGALIYATLEMGQLFPDHKWKAGAVPIAVWLACKWMRA